MGVFCSLCLLKLGFNYWDLELTALKKVYSSHCRASHCLLTVDGGGYIHVHSLYLQNKSNVTVQCILQFLSHYWRALGFVSYGEVSPHTHAEV